MKRITIIAATLLISGSALAELNGGATANVTAGQQQQQQSMSDATATTGSSTSTVGDTSASNAGNTQDVNITFEAEQPIEDTRGRADNPYTTNEFSQSEQLLDQRIQYSGEYKLKNTPNVSAPALTTTMTETCMGSSSAGGSVPGFGLSFGTTWRDSACVRRLDARELNSLGYTLGAKELMCDSDAVRAALLRAGTPCYEDLPNEAKRPEDRAVVAPVVVPAAAAPALGFTSNDGFNIH